MLNGLINVYKEPGYTSMDVCAVLRGITGQKKIGHTGTLDPSAEGVLPICLGNATKLCDMLESKKKEYVATFMLGKKTDTLDITGEVLEERKPRASKEDIEAAIKTFIGGYEQVPPMYSAKFINGQRLYELARKGQTVERKPVFVDIYDIKIEEADLPYVTIRVLCGKGTYIRSLCEDICEKCGELGVMTKLIRTAVDHFTSDKALTIKQLETVRDEGRLSEVVIPTEDAFSDLPRFMVKPDFRKAIDNGNKLKLSMIKEYVSLKDGDRCRISNDEGTFMGVYYYEEKERALKPFKMFLEIK